MDTGSLSVAYQDLVGDVGFFLGFGRGAGNGEQTWTTTQQSSIDRCVKGGLRNWYHCGYDWSFLQPVVTMTVDANAATMLLPDDFGGLEGQISLSRADNSAWGVLNLVSVGQVYQKQDQLSTTTGQPLMACIEPIKGTGLHQRQQFRLHFWPTTDQSYLLRFQYYLAPDFLSGTQPYAYGGPQHAETLLESCLAVAEKLLDDAADVHAQEFEKRLSISQDLDRRNKAQNIGYNGDRSDNGQWDVVAYNRLMRMIGVTFDSISPS